MKGLYRRIFLALLVIPTIALSGCRGLETSPEETDAKIKGQQETLVTRDVVGNRPIWCGPEGRLVYELAGPNPDAYGEGFYVYDLDTGRRLKVGSRGESPVACTPDGEWIIYSDDRSYRADERDPENRAVRDLWRYEFATGKRQRFVIVDGHVAVSFNKPVYPSEGLKLYLGVRPGESIEMPEPGWEIIWSEKNKLGRSTWFPDSSALITTYWGRQDGDYDIVAEVIQPKRKTVVFNPKEMSSISILLADRQNRLYLRGNSEGVIARCDIDIEDEELSCDTVLELERGAPVPDRLCPECPSFPLSAGPRIEGFDLFGDDETMAYMTTEDSCVRVMRIGEEEARCLTAPNLGIGGHVVISPDEKWIAFTIGRKIGEDHGLNVVKEDLYVVEIKTE